MTGGVMCMIIVGAELKVAAWRTRAAASAGEDGEPNNSLSRNKLGLIELMKFSNQLTLTRFAGFSTIALLAGILPATLQAVDQRAAESTLTIRPRSFFSPGEAVKALQLAAEAKDNAALLEIFGPQYAELATGDKVQDANNARKFAAVMAQGCESVKEGEDKITLEVGTNNWPMPIPLVKTDGQWHFDTAAGKEEMISRHIGKDELHAIGVCRAYVSAQKQYADMVPKIGGGANYAQKFKSAPGKKDGLYWPTADNEPASPFGPLVAEAQAEGYGANNGAGLHPFHGYYFKILTQQGPAATDGKLSYLSEGILEGGFALVAFPEHWDQSGIMTFIVNQDGRIYQRNLGENTPQLAGDMKEYNPDGEWTLAQDKGVLNVVSEK
jgi:hypothetical protein